MKHALRSLLASIPKAATQRAMDRRRRFEGRVQRHSAIRAAIAYSKETGFSAQEALLAQGYFFAVRVANRIGIY